VRADGSAETIEHGRARREPRSRRARLVLLALGLCLVVAAAVVDHGVRRREGTQVAGCVRAASSSVRYASTRVDAIAGYVRPALDSPVPASLRRRLNGLVSVSVAPTVPDVRRARDRCLEVRVLAFHDALHATRADCLRLLERDLAYLGAVMGDGSRAFASRALPAGRCVPR
jgi:hypothetical protein